MEKYILKSQIHFGSIQTTVSKGTVVEINRDTNKAVFNGVEHDNVREVEMMIRAGFVIPYVENVTVVDTEINISPKALENKNKKYEVRKSDADHVAKILDTEKNEDESKDDKPSELVIIREENSGEGERGIEVVKHTPPQADRMPVINIDNDLQVMTVMNGDVNVVKKIETSEKSESEITQTIDSDTISAINNSDVRVVKTIGKDKSDPKIDVSGTSKLVAKHASSTSAEKAAANAEARKQSISSSRKSSAAKK